MKKKLVFLKLNDGYFFKLILVILNFRMFFYPKNSPCNLLFRLEATCRTPLVSVTTPAFLDFTELVFIIVDRFILIKFGKSESRPSIVFSVVATTVLLPSLKYTSV